MEAKLKRQNQAVEQAEVAQAQEETKSNRYNFLPPVSQLPSLIKERNQTRLELLKLKKLDTELTNAFAEINRGHLPVNLKLKAGEMHVIRDEQQITRNEYLRDKIISELCETAANTYKSKLVKKEDGELIRHVVKDILKEHFKVEKSSLSLEQFQAKLSNSDDFEFPVIINFVEEGHEGKPQSSFLYTREHFDKTIDQLLERHNLERPAANSPDLRK